MSDEASVSFASIFADHAPDPHIAPPFAATSSSSSVLSLGSLHLSALTLPSNLSFPMGLAASTPEETPAELLTTGVEGSMHTGHTFTLEYEEVDPLPFSVPALSTLFGSIVFDLQNKASFREADQFARVTVKMCKLGGSDSSSVHSSGSRGGRSTPASYSLQPAYTLVEGDVSVTAAQLYQLWSDGVFLRSISIPFLNISTLVVRQSTDDDDVACPWNLVWTEDLQSLRKIPMGLLASAGAALHVKFCNAELPHFVALRWRALNHTCGFPCMLADEVLPIVRRLVSDSGSSTGGSTACKSSPPVIVKREDAGNAASSNIRWVTFEVTTRDGRRVKRRLPLPASPEEQSAATSSSAQSAATSSSAQSAATSSSAQSAATSSSAQSAATSSSAQ